MELAVTCVSLELRLGVLARDAVERDAPARQEARDVEGALGAAAARHQLGAEGRLHAGPRPAVGRGARRVVVGRLPSPCLLLAPAAEQERGADRAGHQPQRTQQASSAPTFLPRPLF